MLGFLAKLKTTYISNTPFRNVLIINNLLWDGCDSDLTFSKMRANLKSLWVRRLIAKPRVPYNRALRVRGSSHPVLNHDYELFLPPFAAASKVFRVHFASSRFQWIARASLARCAGSNHACFRLFPFRAALRQRVGGTRFGLACQDKTMTCESPVRGDIYVEPGPNGISSSARSDIFRLEQGVILDWASCAEYTAPTELGISAGLYSTDISLLTELPSARLYFIVHQCLMPYVSAILPDGAWIGANRIGSLYFASVFQCLTAACALLRQAFLLRMACGEQDGGRAIRNPQSAIRNYFSPPARTVSKWGGSSSRATTDTSILRKPAASSQWCKSLSEKPSQRSPCNSRACSKVCCNKSRIMICPRERRMAWALRMACSGLAA